MTFPSTFTTFTYPKATDRLNSPSHSSVHVQVASSLGQVEAVLGVSGNNSVLGTIIGDLYSPGSKGGGHIQGAAFGGTGQTTFTKGDVLVATGASVLTKLAVGNDNQILTANSSAAAGINWANSGSPKIYTNASVVAVTTTGETSIFSTSVFGSTLGTNNAVRTTAYLTNWSLSAGGSVLVGFQYGGQMVSSVAFGPTAGTTSSIYGVFTHTIIANSSVNSQRHFLNAEVILYSADTGTGATSGNVKFTPFVNNMGSIYTIRASDRQVSSINSSANQVIGMTIRDLANTQSITVNGIIVEKII